MFNDPIFTLLFEIHMILYKYVVRFRQGAKGCQDHVHSLKNVKNASLFAVIWKWTIKFYIICIYKIIYKNMGVNFQKKNELL